MGKLVEVAKTDEIAPGGAKAVEVEGETIAIFNLDGEYYAIDDTCPHALGPLSEGEIEEGVVICPWHASEFDIKTGEVLCPPAAEGVRSYKVYVEGDTIKIEID